MGIPVDLGTPRAAEADETSSEEGWVEEGEEGEDWDDPSADGVLGRVFEAAETGDADELADLLQDLDVSIDTRGADSDTALHLAALYGHADCVRLLLDRGARADVADADGSLPLHDAAAGGYASIVDMLLAAAPDTIDRGDSEGDTALHNAARGSHAEVVDVLVRSGADLTLQNDDFKTALQLAERGSAARQLLEEAAQRAEAEAPQVAPPAAEVA